MNDNKKLVEDNLIIDIRHKFTLRERLRILFGSEVVAHVSCHVTAFDQGNKVTLEFSGPFLETYIVKAGK